MLNHDHDTHDRCQRFDLTEQAWIDSTLDECERHDHKHDGLYTPSRPGSTPRPTNATGTTTTTRNPRPCGSRDKLRL